MTLLESAFKDKLNHRLFLYDGEYYESIDDCVVKRSFSNKLWSPKNIPFMHQIKLNHYGFVLKYSDELCAKAIVYTNLKEEQVIKSLLFVIYFEQVFSDIEQKVKSKYNEVYQYLKKCLKHSSSEFNIETVYWSSYKPACGNDNCTLIISKNKKINDFIRLQDIISCYEIVNIPIYDESSLTTGLVRWIERNKDKRFNIHNCFSSYSVILENFQKVHNNVNVIECDKFDFSNTDVYLFGATISDDKFDNWDSIFIIE